MHGRERAQRVSHASGAGHGAPASERVGESEGRSPSGEMMRRKLLWLIGGRAAVITLLLGSATLIQIKELGSFPIDPFFGLIGLTYGLTAVWTLTLRFVDRQPWL